MTMRIAMMRSLNRLYRRVKTFVLVHRPPLLTGLFFRATRLVDHGLSGRHPTNAERLANTLWKQAYFDRWSRPDADRLRLLTEHPIAYRSDDHRFPRGTVFDNSTNERFNCRLYEMLGFAENLRFLDLGCAGGGLVRSYLEDGYQAIGLEGSDHSKRHRSGEWDTIPYHCFTCDITKEFSVVDRQGQPVVFDAVTAWEVLEHIAEQDVGGLLDRIHRHLRPTRYFVGSIDLLPDGNPLTGAVYHQTLRPAAWWLHQFVLHGFRIVEDHPFAPEDMVRGNGSSLKDWHPADGYGLHVVAQRVS
jgi:2-polyprenyl-3-methyl-5-hydroxy-6-metoxy-1,4-benzoquinol methylase